MSDTPEDHLRLALEDLIGRQPPLTTALPHGALKPLESAGSGIGYSQLNELLILLGFDRITRSFFQYLVDGTTEYQPTATIRSVEHLRKGISNFTKLALLFYGNVRYAFKTLSRDGALLEEKVASLLPVPTIEFEQRHNTVCPIDPIAGLETYYLGYLIEAELNGRLKSNPDDPIALGEEQIRQATVKRGKANHYAYLASDHLDVYVATSMRQRHEFLAVSRLTAEIFNHPELVKLKLRWFDPTQAYCPNRVDKGLSEALMLRRAQCTIYFAQESDTLGKDSELASTLAQGKTVIAFVPDGKQPFTTQLMADLSTAYPDRREIDLLLEQLRIYSPHSAWNDPTVRGWLDDPKTAALSEVRQRLEEQVVSHYNRRAQTLKESHPLGIQVNLETGVANGVLVIRTVSDCASLVRRILTRTLEFELTNEGEKGFVTLREKISGSIYRVVTNDVMLTNSFWNFYLEPRE